MVNNLIKRAEAVIGLKVFSKINDKIYKQGENLLKDLKREYGYCFS